MARSSTKTQGFTLVEMMVVVAIIGIVAASVGPGLGGVMADSRQGSASVEVLRHLRMARSRAIHLGVAHLVTFDATLGGDHGELATFAGMTSRCPRTPWGQNPTIQPGSISPAVPVLTVPMQRYNGANTSAADTRRHVIALRAQHPVSTDVSLLHVCYEPSGATYSRTAVTDPLERQLADALLRIQRTMGGVVQGATREVILPAGGAPRFR